MPDQKRKEFQRLVDKYLNGTATPEEQEALDRYYLLFRDEPEDTGLLTKKQMLALEERMENGLFNRIQKSAGVKRLWPRIAAAASIVLFLSFGGYYLLHKQKPQQQTAQINKQDLQPGSDKAILTTSNGQKIDLTAARKGKITVQGNTTVNKTGDGHIVYEQAQQSSGSAEPLAYNTMTTPRGGQHPLTLSDGTKVWLDAASSITFPVVFGGNDRSVKITGQVYFEVAHNPAKPFRVSANGQTVEVLGTHFNINAYTDEPEMKTTLLEGSVKIIKDGKTAVLIPGQQALVSFGPAKNIVVKEADTEEAIAWHKGLFQFHDTNIQTVMRQLSRWYDVDISYEGKIHDRQFSGKMYRNVTALTIADILSYKKIHFRIEGKKIIVEP
ncbi:FecR family protein [Mucilaginibacter sp.]|jgi:hypothetical protein|uniref:FecR family protein n=1 Tax=Mucilaginibacter sp. TaxID=1882438 RepID=UPI0035615C55